MIYGFKAAERAPIQDSIVIRPNECAEKIVFSNLSCEFGKMLHVYSPYGLIQAIGYLKYKAAIQKNRYGILYRGQSSLYPSLIPSLYRKIDTKHSKEDCDSDFLKKIDDAKKEKSTKYDDLYKFVDVKEELLPPLLQHYGLETPWLDVVDNIWVALWFACHKRIKPYVISTDRKHIHYQQELNRTVAKYTLYRLRREQEKNDAWLKKIQEINNKIQSEYRRLHHNSINPIIPQDRKKFLLKKANDKLNQLHTKRQLLENSPTFCYIILLRTPLPSADASDTKICGCWINDKTKLLDLRVSIPSYYLRPHAQHGLMLTRVDNKIDYMDLVEGIIRINLADAISWIGNSQTLSMNSLFPSPCYDNGLRKLLNIRAFADYLEIPT